MLQHICTYEYVHVYKYIDYTLKAVYFVYPFCLIDYTIYCPIDTKTTLAKRSLNS